MSTKWWIDNVVYKGVFLSSKEKIIMKKIENVDRKINSVK